MIELIIDPDQKNDLCCYDDIIVTARRKVVYSAISKNCNSEFKRWNSNAGMMSRVLSCANMI